jgi:hypothetical protein
MSAWSFEEFVWSLVCELFWKLSWWRERVKEVEKLRVRGWTKLLEKWKIKNYNEKW